MTLRISAVSLTLLVNVPGSSWSSLAGQTPCLEVRPTVGFSPTTADLEAGKEMLPLFYILSYCHMPFGDDHTSVPKQPAANPNLAATALPDEDPAGFCRS